MLRLKVRRFMAPGSAWVSNTPNGARFIGLMLQLAMVGRKRRSRKRCSSSFISSAVDSTAKAAGLSWGPVIGKRVRPDNGFRCVPVLRFDVVVALRHCRPTKESRVTTFCTLVFGSWDDHHPSHSPPVVAPCCCQPKTSQTTIQSARGYS
ncbi:hypothetical protein T440DRAFT_258849 [Plenodomus tracheiphilus IPT5]|uniref:Uncharacterized protein n=1 Tax=Plenodomus tracheiphilus IPT5 TaxID=1408161 RepID=A0A6A7ATH8_9PLEO|nr:hypothetical protein T440DRAFT_258849 [Plenodomus tracheiphilus IPT5]